MLIVKFMGVIDILTAVSFWIFAVFKIQSLSSWVLLLALILLVKGLIFVLNLNFISILDVISAFFITYATESPISIVIVIIISIFLLQKGIFSLLS